MVVVVGSVVVVVGGVVVLVVTIVTGATSVLDVDEPAGSAAGIEHATTISITTRSGIARMTRR